MRVPPRAATTTNTNTTTNSAASTITTNSVATYATYAPEVAVVTTEAAADDRNSKSSNSNSNSNSSSDLGVPTEIIEVVFKIAACRLNPGGFLVFWLPTDAHVTESQVCALLQRVLLYSTATEHESNDAAVECSALKLHLRRSLKFHRVTPDKLNNRLWRWLCVYQWLEEDM